MCDQEQPSSSDRASAGTGVTRKTLERLPVPGDRRELVLVEVCYPPAGVAPAHWHSVCGAVFIIDGIAESAYGSDAPRRYHAGQTFIDRTDEPHTLFRNCDPVRPLRFLISYVIEPGTSYILDAHAPGTPPPDVHGENRAASPS